MISLEMNESVMHFVLRETDAYEQETVQSSSLDYMGQYILAIL
jgi:hypothetical protein